MASHDTPADRIAVLARAVLDTLPEPFGAPARGVVIQVLEWPPNDVLNDLGISHPLDLTGLYDGVPLTQKSVMAPEPRSDMVWLFVQPILDELAQRPGETLATLVRHIVVHEIAHHFGWSDDDIAAVDRWWE